MFDELNLFYVYLIISEKYKNLKHMLDIQIT